MRLGLAGLLYTSVLISLVPSYLPTYFAIFLSGLPEIKDVIAPMSPAASWAGCHTLPDSAACWGVMARSQRICPSGRAGVLQQASSLARVPQSGKLAGIVCAAVQHQE